MRKLSRLCELYAGLPAVTFSYGGQARRSPAKAGRRRVSYNGNTIGFQPVDGGPIPPTRS